MHGAYKAFFYPFTRSPTSYPHRYLPRVG